MNMEELGKEKEPKEQERNPWYDYNIENNNEMLLNETIVTLRLTKKHYRTAYTLAHMLGFKSLDDYISDIVVHNIEMEITGGDIKNYSNLIINKMSNDTTASSFSCYWLCNCKAELKYIQTLEISCICAKAVMRYTIPHTG